VSDLKPDDFSKLRDVINKRWGLVRRGNEIVRVRSIFKWGYESDKYANPVKFGPEFKKPKASDVDAARAPEEERMYTAAEIRALLDYAKGPIRAMILLGINCGFGNGDCSSLPLSALDLDNGFLKFRRPKTSVDRRAALWPETVAALREVIANRPKARDAADEDCVFLTKYGRRWVREGTNAVGLEFGKLFKTSDPDATDPNRSGVEDIEGRGFYHLRHSFRTVADETLDFPAVRVFMGHKDRSIDATYRKLISQDRLRVVADHVRHWLFPAVDKCK
jgi:integrase